MLAQHLKGCCGVVVVHVAAYAVKLKACNMDLKGTSIYDARLWRHMLTPSGWPIDSFIVPSYIRQPDLTSQISRARGLRMEMLTTGCLLVHLCSLGGWHQVCHADQAVG
jgi:hypothetical protein